MRCDTERLHDFNKENTWFNQDNIEESTATSVSAKKIRRDQVMIVILTIT